jgi:hypothetical protein
MWRRSALRIIGDIEREAFLKSRVPVPLRPLVEPVEVSAECLGNAEPVTDVVQAV